MELVVNQNLEFEPEPIVVPQIKTEGILNSKYQLIVKQNFNKSSKSSVFGIRQRIKVFQHNSINHTAVLLKLSLFAAFLIVMF